jgi:hypothetical protein
MNRNRLRSSLAGLATLVVFSLVVVVFGPSPEGESKQAAAPVKKPRPEGRPIPMPTQLTGLDIVLGVKDKEATKWDGEVQLSEGRIVEMTIKGGGPKSKVEGTRFQARSVAEGAKAKQTVNRPRLHINVDAPSKATLSIKTKQGNAQFALAELPMDSAKTYLDGGIVVERLDGAVRLTGRETEDDYPALARGPDGNLWLSYVEYQPGKPIVNERVQAGGFDELVPKDHGDQILLVRFDGKTWQPAIAVTDAGLDVWRPTVTVDGKGRVVVAWAQQVDGDWDIYYRRYTPNKGGKGEWSEVVRATKERGADFNVVSTTDAKGNVWLAWQAWRDNHFIILATHLDDALPAFPATVYSTSKANNWNPSIAADSKGTVYVAWDTYDKGNYDVCLRTNAKDATVRTVAGSARFEARPSLGCDAKDRLWIAYEEGDDLWGKDYATEQFSKIGLKSNPGSGLYLKRTVKVKCLTDAGLQQPAADIEEVFKATPRRNKSCPRLAIDRDGGVWVLYRQHPYVGGAGEIWNSYAVRYDGKQWSAPRRLSSSANLMDNRPALAPFGSGLMVVYSGDGRLRTQNRDQSDLFASILGAMGPAQEPQLAADAPPADDKRPPVHADEPGDVARMRSYRIDAGGKKLQLLRGEFHRHTEYSSHRDGDGSIEDAWRYGIDAGAMDWIGVGDHDNGFGSEFHWWQFQKLTDLYHNPPHFVGVYTYERSVVYPDGHRNIILPKRGVRPLPRGDMKGTPEKGTPDTKVLFAYLKHFGGICASHTSGTTMGTDWRDNDPLVEPIVEIYQGHRHNYEHFGAPRSATKETNIGGYEPAGFIWNALEKGYRFGFQASSDHMSTHMSYAIAMVEEPSRQALIDAFKKRHCYAATDNILLDVRSGPQLMGDAFTATARPTLDIIVHGTGPVAKVHVIRDNKYVYSNEPKKAEVKLRYTDTDIKPGTTSYYYVRIEQADGNLAWGSPMWITYKP